MKSFKASVVKILLIFAAMLMLGTNISAQVNVTLPTVTGTAGQVKYGDVTVGDLTGQNVTAFQFTVTYNNSIVYITGVDVTGGKVSASDLVVNADTLNGRISVAWAKATPLSGSGTLLKLRFKFRNVGTTALNFGAPLNFQFNAGAPAANVTAGSATTAAIMVYGGTVTAATSATQFMIPIYVTPLTVGNNIVSYNFTATYNPAVLELVTPGYDLAGTLSAGGSAQINYNNTTGVVNFAWAKSSAITTTSDAVLVYLLAKPKAAGVSALNITSFMFNAGNPAAATQAGSVTISTSAPTLTLNPVSPYTVNENVGLTITLNGNDPDGTALAYSGTPMPSGATLVGNTFSWTPSYTQAGTYSITFTVTDANSETATAVASITVNDVNRAPTLTANPVGPYTIPEGSPFQIQLVRVDPDTDNTWVFSSSTLPTGASLNSSLGTFTWTPSYTQAGTYTITFTVTDNKGASASLVANITVTNVNRAPVFTTVLPAGRVVPVHNVPVSWSFFYTASDPDADPLTFSLEAGPDGSSITANGIFSWIPTPDQAGKSYIVTVKVTDGTLSAMHSQTISASSTITGVDDELSGIPTEFQLLQNYPNPFNPTTSISFGLPKESYVRLSVFNVIGEEVSVLVDKTMGAGYHKVDFNASELNTGIYLYRVQAGDFVSVKKMLLVK